MTNRPEKRIYRFDGFHLDGDTLMLYRSGETIKLPPKAVEILLVFVENRGDILGKDDLMDAVWKGSVVEESNLTQYLYLLRKELGTRPTGEPYIETLRKRGYRFEADSVETAEGESAARQAAQPRANVPVRYNYALAGTALLLVVAVIAAVWTGNKGSESPGRTEQINVSRLTNGIEINGAVISPDGKYFTYNEIDGQRSRIWVQQTGQSHQIEVVPWVDRWHGAKTFTPDGQFIYFLEHAGDSPTTLNRVPTLGGTAVKVLTGIDSPVAFSPNGQEFAFYRYDREAERSEIVIRPTDGTAPERTLLSWKDAKTLSFVSWSPDGGRIAFTTNTYFEPKGSVTIATVDIATGKVEKLSRETWETCYRIEWKPDGEGLYAIATREGDGYTTRRDQLYYVPLAGEPRRLTFDGSRLQLDSLSITDSGAVLVVPFNRSSQIWWMAASGDSRTAVQLTTGLADGRAGIAPLPDGRVAYIARAGEDLSVWTMREDGSEQTQLTNEPKFMEEIRASRDGKTLFVSVPDGRQNNLFRMNADGTGLTQITFGMHVIDSGPSHDGKWLAFDASDVSQAGEEIALLKLPTEGGEPVTLKTKGCGRPHFSPDDRFLSCVTTNSISVISADDGTLINSFNALPRASLHFGARWTPDGNALAYIVTEKGVSNIWVQPIDGSAPRKLTDFTVGSIYHFAFSHDGQRLFLARGTQIRDALLISTTE